MLTAYFGGGLVCGIVFAAAAVVVIFLAIKRSRLTLCAAGLLCGLIVMSLHVKLYCEPIMRFGGSTVKAELVVNRVTMRSGGTRDYIAEINLDGRRAKVEIESDRSRLEVGDRAAAVVALNPPDSDNAVRNLADGVLLSGEITELTSVTRGKTDVYTFIRGLRERMLEALGANVHGEGGELSLAILLGEDAALSPVLREKLRICGAAHYTAVSGSHFAVFAAVLLGIIPESRRRTRHAVSLLFAPAAVIFLVTPSVLRASVMFLLHSLAPFFRRKSDTLNSLCAAVTLICLFSPGTVLDTGFALSVLGVFGAGVVGVRFSEKLDEFIPDRLKMLEPAANVLAVSVCAVVCTSPVSVFAFKGVSMLGALVSLLLVPLMTVGVAFSVPLALTGSGIFALPVDLAMRAAAAVVDFFGGARGAWVTLDFRFAWVLAALCAVLLTAAAFGNIRTFSLLGKFIFVPIAASMLISRYTISERSEVRFVGNYSTSAAVVFEDREAAVFISGSGTGLASGISRLMREHGAERISCIAAFDADYGGALSIRELSELAEVDTVFSNSVVRDLLTETDVRIVPEDAVLSVSGVTFAASSSDGEAADIVLYNGRLPAEPESGARYAIYFSSAEKDMPENWHNARRDRDFCIPLENGEKKITIIQRER